MAGTAQVIRLGSLSYDEEASFAAATSTSDKALQIRDATLTPAGLVQEMVPRGGVFQRPDQGDNHIPGVFTTASLTFTMDLYGHGTTTAGSLSQTPVARLLGHAVGNADSSVIGGSATSDSSGDSDIVSSNITLVEGQMVRAGALGDTRGGGQANVSKDVSDTTGFDMKASYTDDLNSGDVIYGLQTIFPADTTGAAHLTSNSAGNNNTLRFLAATGAQQWVLRGCACTGISFGGLNTGEVPSVTFTFGVAFWDDMDAAYPVALSPADKAPAPTANGSFQIQAVGTTTNNYEVIRNFAIDIAHEVFPIMGPGGINDKQVIVGWVRGGSRPTVTFDVEAQDAAASPTWSAWWETDPNTIVNKYLIYTMNVVDGRSVVWHLPNMRPAGQRPTQVEVDGLTYVSVTCEGLEFTGSDNDTNVARSSWRLGLG